MLKHEAKLINPDADEIVAAFSEAVEGANKRCRARLLEDKPEKWRKFARDCAAKPEGFAMFRGGRGGIPATQVLGAWWTDAIGRKHVVLRGRRVEHDEAKRLLQNDELDARPPLWHAYPEYVCHRMVGKDSQLVCACGCGAVGTPTALGWMGETCGPCFDRKEELGVAGLHANLPGVLYGDRAPLGAVACSPDGIRVAAKEGDNGATYWDIATRTRTVMKFTDARVTDVAITSDGGHLLVSGFHGTGGLYAAFDLSADPPKRVDASELTDICRVVPMADPTFALATRWRLGDTAIRPDVIRIPSGESVRRVDLPADYSGAFVFSPDWQRLALANDDNATTHDPVTLRALKAFGQIGLFVRFSHDGRRLIGGYPSRISAYDADTEKLVADGFLDGKKGGPQDDWVTALAVGPEGEWIYAGSHQGRVYAFAADALALRAVFEWHLGEVEGLAVSVDGSRLFSSGTDGCVKVWPIRDLMKGV